MRTSLRNAAVVLALATAALPLAARADDPVARTGSKTSHTITIDALSKAFQSLSPEARATLVHELETRGVAGISGMNPNQARQAFADLPANVRTELQARWDSLSDEQREEIKQLGPDAVKKMLADKLKEAIKPPQELVDAGAAVVEKSNAFTDTVRAFWAKLGGGAPEGEHPTEAKAGGN
jgi:hypothetical protein